jgi:nitrous oxidase accessory protein NosD
MSGTGNVLRNNVIEVESATAAYLYGPGSVIEGNTFIVHQTKGEPAATLAILKLRDAHGAVIRNNRFIVKGVFVGKAEAAINLLESKNVVIEGNTIEGAKTLVRKDAASTTLEKGNGVK